MRAAVIHSPSVSPSSEAPASFHGAIGLRVVRLATSGVAWGVAVSSVLLIWAVFGLGWLIVLLSTFLLNHFELFGLSQVWRALRGRAAAAPMMREPQFYRVVRHPLYSGFLLAFWATPAMTVGHLLFAGGMTAYILIAIRHEERDLIALFGADYERYRARVGMLTPRWRP